MRAIHIAAGLVGLLFSSSAQADTFDAAATRTGSSTNEAT